MNALASFPSTVPDGWELLTQKQMAQRLNIEDTKFEELKAQKKIIPIVLGARCHRYHAPSVIYRLLKASGAYEPEVLSALGTAR